jgi:nucleoid-associated protein YgaU
MGKDHDGCGLQGWSGWDAFWLESQEMPNDAKIGLAVGVTLVIAAAVVFQQNNPSAPTASLTPSAVSAPLSSPELPRPRQHTVQAGETLTEIARRYYGDRSKSLTIYRVNRNRLLSPDRVPAGTVLVLPDLPED